MLGAHSRLRVQRNGHVCLRHKGFQQRQFRTAEEVKAVQNDSRGQWSPGPDRPSGGRANLRWVHPAPLLQVSYIRSVYGAERHQTGGAELRGSSRERLRLDALGQKVTDGSAHKVPKPLGA